VSVRRLFAIGQVNPTCHLFLRERRKLRVGLVKHFAANVRPEFF
jgi:hypothetical protein